MEKKRISTGQLQILMFFYIYGASTTFMPRIAAHYAGGWGWVLIIGATAFGLVFSYIINSAAELFPSDTLTGYSEKIVGRPIGILLSVAFALKIILTTGLELRIFCEILRQTMLFKTPIVITSGIMVAAGVYLAASGFATNARLAKAVIIPVMITILIINITAIAGANFSNLQSVHKITGFDLFVGSFYLSYAFRGIELTLLVYPLVENNEKVKHSMSKVILATGAVMLLTTVATLLSFGSNTVKEMLWPVIQMMDAVSLPGNILERQDAIILGIWIAGLFISIGVGIYFPANIFNDLFNNKSKAFIAISAIAILAASQLPANIVEAHMWLMLADLTVGTAYLFVIPSLLYLVAKLRRVGRRAG